MTALWLLLAAVAPVHLVVAGVPVDVLAPALSPGAAPRADILLLPGWDGRADDWCRETTLCEDALRRGYRLVMPAMGKSLYSSGFYPETKPVYRRSPDR